MAQGQLPTRVTVTFATTGDAFHGEAFPHEAARLLRLAADRIEAGDSTVRLRDSAGNRVGYAAVDTEAAAS